MEQESLRSSLRQRTRELHARLDAALTGPTGRVTDRDGYLRVLRSLHALHDLVDAPLRRWAAESPAASSIAKTLLPDRTTAYAADLDALGHPPTTNHVSDSAVDTARGLAFLYLVAGSAAGARVLLRGLPDTVPVEARTGLTDAAGGSSTRLWREAVALLEHPASPALRDAVVAEACAVLELLLALARSEPRSEHLSEQESELVAS